MNRLWWSSGFDRASEAHLGALGAHIVSTLSSVERVKNLVAFYVEEHNQRLPHSAFRGQTPDEMYFGKGVGVPDALDAGKKAARRKRLALNRALSCAVCDEAQESDAA